MSARQFEKDVRRKAEKAFGKASAEAIANAGQFAKLCGGISGCIKSIISLEEANKQHTQQVFPQAPHGHFHVLSTADMGSHTHELSYSRVNPRVMTDWSSTRVNYWDCPYCDANHDLAVKLCDCCGARRRREYVC